MSRKYVVDKDFKGVHFSKNELASTDFEGCTFTTCIFSDTKLDQTSFSKLQHTSFQEVEFTDCKLIGLRFDYCNEFLLAMNFKSCQLNLSSFYQLNLKNSSFESCSLKEVDFTEANLSELVLNFCDLSQAIFDQSILEKTDFRTANNYNIRLENNRIKGSQFSTSGLMGLLSHYDIEIEE